MQSFIMFQRKSTLEFLISFYPRSIYPRGIRQSQLLCLIVMDHRRHIYLSLQNITQVENLSLSSNICKAHRYLQSYDKTLCVCRPRRNKQTFFALETGVGRAKFKVSNQDTSTYYFILMILFLKQLVRRVKFQNF